jgi:hypothetical protein
MIKHQVLIKQYDEIAGHQRAMRRSMIDTRFCVRAKALHGISAILNAQLDSRTILILIQMLAPINKLNRERLSS